MNHEELKQALLEMLNEDSEKGKTWFFPSNVSDRYTVILGLDLKQSLQAVGVSILSILLTILLFRSSGIFALILYVIVGLISFGVVWAYHIIKPIPDRANISIADFMKQKKSFAKRQKVFYQKTKKRI